MTIARLFKILFIVMFLSMFEICPLEIKLSIHSTRIWLEFIVPATQKSGMTKYEIREVSPDDDVTKVVVVFRGEK